MSILEQHCSKSPYVPAAADTRKLRLLVAQIFGHLSSIQGFPSGIMVKNLPAHAGDVEDMSSVPGLGISPRERNGNPLRYSCLENSMDRGAWWATVLEAAKSQTWLNTNESVQFKLVFVQESTVYRIRFQ